MSRYRKIPVEIDAIEWTGVNESDVYLFTHHQSYTTLQGDLMIQTLEGDMLAKTGDMIIRGIKGEYYPCRRDIFDLTYEEGNAET